MNVGEYGLAFNMNVNYDLSSYTTLSLAFTRPDGTVFTATNPQVTISASPLTTTLGTFAANQYVNYITATGNITVPGTYSVRLTYTDSTKRLISDTATFTVNP